MSKYLKNRAAVFAYAFFTFCCISFQFKEGVFRIFPTCEIAANGLMVSDTLVFYTPAVLGIYMIYHWILKHWKDKYPALFYVLLAGVSGFFSFMTFMGKYYRSGQTVSVSEILAADYAWIRAGICFLGGVLLFFFVFLGIGSLKNWGKEREKRTAGPANKILDFLFGKHCFLKQCMVLGVCWLPHVVIRYPGAMWIDSYNALSQYYGQTEMTTQHPLIYTVLLGKLTDWGLKMGDASYGLFVLTLTQTVLALLVLAYCISAMRKLQLPRWLCCVTMVIFCLSPDIISYVTMGNIDGPYCIAVILLMVELVHYLFAREEYFTGRKHLVLTFLAVAGTFFRYNGFYVVALVIVLVFFRELFLFLREKRKSCFRCLVLLFLALVIPAMAGKASVRFLNSHYQAVNVSKRAKYALPIQQIARYMVAHGDDVTEEEMETLQKVMKYSVEEYKTRYSPHSFNGVKGGFNNDATKEELIGFLKVWIRLFFRHPQTYVAAWVNQNYYAFCPLVDNTRYYLNCQTFSKLGQYDLSDLFIGLTDSEYWSEKQEELLEYYESFTNFPILGLMVNAAWYVLLLFGICIYALFEKKWKIWFLSMPSWIGLAIVLVGPALKGHQRYLFPLMYSMPLLLGMLFYHDKNDTETERSVSETELQMDSPAAEV